MADELNKNLGLLKEKRLNPRDYRFGMTPGLTYQIHNPESDWSEDLPVFEPQSRPGIFDTMSCVTFAGLNCIEMLYHRQRGKEINLSDRFTAVMSNTTKKGNYMSNVAESIRKDGVVLERLYPFGDVVTWEEYHKKPLDPQLVSKATQWNDQWQVGWEWVGVSFPTIKEVLKLSPISVTVKIGSPKNSKGYYIDRPGSYQHVEALYKAGADYVETFNPYTNTFKKYDKTYTFGAAMRWSLTPKIMPEKKNPLNLKEDTLVTIDDRENGRQFITLFVNGKLIVDNELHIMKAWFGRNADGDGEKQMFSGGPTRTISRVDFNKYSKVNLKGEPIEV